MLLACSPYRFRNKSQWFVDRALLPIASSGRKYVGPEQPFFHSPGERTSTICNEDCVRSALHAICPILSSGNPLRATLSSADHNSRLCVTGSHK